VIEEHRLREEQALTRDEAAVVTQALRGVITEGTASYYHDLDAEIGRPSAGKTGTTNNFVDAWFIGFIPQLTTSVWVGYPDERRPMVNINGLPEINGENYPLDIWSLYMQNAVQMFPEQQFDVPSPYLDLEVKTDGRTYVKPEETTEETDEATESTTSEEEPDRKPAAREPVQPLQPAPRLASPTPRASPPAARPARDGVGPRRGPPAANDGPRRRPLR
jgi:penicillin-binding protein 1A